MRLSQKAGRPVRMVMDHDEVFMATGPASASKVTIKMGANKAGEITAAELWMAYGRRLPGLRHRRRFDDHARAVNVRTSSSRATTSS